MDKNTAHIQHINAARQGDDLKNYYARIILAIVVAYANAVKFQLKFCFN